MLTGSNGSIAYPLLRPEGNTRRPLIGYQVLSIANVHTADAAELQFGVVSAKDLSAAPRHVIRLMKDRVQLGTRSSAHGPLTSVIAERELNSDSERDHELRLERHERDWYVAIDGTPLGSVPLPDVPVRPEFLLAAEGSGIAQYSDIILEELGPPTATSP